MIPLEIIAILTFTAIFALAAANIAQRTQQKEDTKEVSIQGR